MELQLNKGTISQMRRQHGRTRSHYYYHTL